MMHRHVFEAVDRTLRDIMADVAEKNQYELFGGKVVVMGGDFRQILPIVKHGTRGDIVAASLNQSRIWRGVRVFKLHTNMRVARLLAEGDVAGAVEQQNFAQFLGRVGDGTEPTFPAVGDEFVRVPDGMLCSGGANATVADLIQDVYGGLDGTFDTEHGREEYIIGRAILTPLNEDVDRINAGVMANFVLCGADGAPAASQVYKSADCVVEGEQSGYYPVEFLNTLHFSGMPPHELHLKVGCPVILLRNMSGGLANGTRLIVHKLYPRVLEAVVATGPRKGEVAFIPRIDITPSDAENWPFTMRRRQFPVRPAFAMTVNKAQGQTLSAVGLYLPQPVFSHGQLYVAFSRVGRPQGIKVLVVGGRVQGVPGVPGGVYTKNVVYREVFGAG